jgi:hypothetical protein
MSQEATNIMRKPRLPPGQKPRDHRVQAARATFSQILDTIPMTLPVLRGHSDFSQVCFVYLQRRRGFQVHRGEWGPVG